MNNNKKIILGIHFGHDAGAAIIKDGQIIADVSEERFNRVKHSADYPLQSIAYCLKIADVPIKKVDEIAIAELRLDDSFENIFGKRITTPNLNQGNRTIKQHLFEIRKILANLILPQRKNSEIGYKTPIYLRRFFLDKLPKVTFVEHHLAHAASAYYTTNDKRKMIIATIDGIGDKFSSCIWLGEDGKITPLIKYGQESSIAWFYSNVTEALGWWHGDGEGKTMGLAPYGDYTKCQGQLDGLYPTFKDGYLEQPYTFPNIYPYKQTGTYQWHCGDSFKVSELIKKYGRENIAAESQRVFEEQIMNFVMPWLEKKNTEILAAAGGVFLNVKLNQRIWMSGKIKTHYPYANAGDSGLALGAALYASAMDNTSAEKINDLLYNGPEYDNAEIEKILKLRGIAYKRSDDIAFEAAQFLADNKIIGWFQGRMEAGPRALGNRSILMSPKKAENKDIINALVKFREPFRPFCPSMIDEAKNEYLVNARSEKYMITSFDCKPEKISELPAVVHVDGTLRPQTVTKEDNPLYHKLISEFGKLTGTPVLLNSSFNVRGEPIVCTPNQAIKCFYDNGIDVLIIENFIIEKPTTPKR
jgi:carbamoyltransferase